ncbi:MAG: phosphatase PAP2 family protein [Candidatus Heimdallarchaeota archaeon]
MAELPFNQELVNWLRDNRTDSLTVIFKFFTFLGSEMGYILIVLGIYWLYNKNLALRLTMVVIVTSALNQLIKVIIKNPRPYVSNDTYKENWAISENEIEETATSYSTPSGHAMGSASFWTFIHYKIQSPKTKILAIVMIILIGLSRPYLGVHYFEDVIIGWVLGLLVVYIILKYEKTIVEKWESVSQRTGIVAIIIVAFFVMIIGGITTSFGTDGVIYATLSGLITGLIVGYNIETNKVGFIAETKSVVNGVLRFLIGIILSLGVLLGLKSVFAEIAKDESEIGYILRFIRYATLGIVATVLTGKIFLSLGLADTHFQIKEN